MPPDDQIEVSTVADAVATPPAVQAEVDSAPSQAGSDVEASPAVSAAGDVAPADAGATQEGAEPGPAETPSLLEKFVTERDGAEKPAAEEAKAETKAEPEKAPGAEAKPDADKAAEPAPEAAPEPIVYEDFTLPEGVSLQGDGLDAFKTLAGTDRLPQDRAQKYLDMHVSALRDFENRIRQDQFKVFNDTRRNWQTEVMADPEIGGAGHETAMGAIARMRDKFVSSARPDSQQYQDDVARFDEFLRVTGAGDHPAFLRFLHNTAQMFDAPRPLDTEIRPAPNNGRAPKRGLSALYDNPTSGHNRNS